ncbi:hypothetical protein COOONC_21318 [Cooperia oncophora]
MANPKETAKTAKVSTKVAVEERRAGTPCREACHILPVNCNFEVGRTDVMSTSINFWPNSYHMLAMLETQPGQVYQSVREVALRREGSRTNGIMASREVISLGIRAKAVIDTGSVISIISLETLRRAQKEGAYLYNM